jgi:hypothetical protein
MIWITWRRYRVRLVIVAMYVLVLIVFMIITEHAFQVAVHKCVQALTPNVHINCSSASPVGPDTKVMRPFSRVLRTESHASQVAIGILFLPILIGSVFGTPLIASEMDAKTNRLAWSQSVTRTRWFLTSWLTLAIPAVSAMSLFALIVQWWVTHINASLFSGGGLNQQLPFEISGVVAIAYTIFALSFGVCVGILVRRFVSPYPVTFLIGGYVGSYVCEENRYPLNTHYWEGQWNAAAIFLAMSAVLLGLTVVAVRRWRT